MARHDAAGKEMLRDPIALVVGIEAIGAIAMRKDVDEQPPLGLEPGSRRSQKPPPVRHMLEHFDGDDAVEARVDKSPLAVRVRDSRDERLGKTFRHSKRQRAPAAAELQDPLAVGKRGPRDRLVKRADFRLRQRRSRKIVKTAGIFSAWAEEQLKEFWRQFIVLGVGFTRAKGDRVMVHLARKVFF